MNSLRTIILLLFTVLLSFATYAQIPATVLKKNISKKTNLSQELNVSKDTLILKNENNILRVTFLNHVDDKETIIDVASKEVRIPLYHFEVGRYTIPVYVDGDIIIVGMTRVLDIPTPKDATADLETSILESSLSNEEKKSRGIETKEKEEPIIAKVKPKKEREEVDKVLRDNIREDRLASLEKLKRERAKKKEDILEGRLKKRKQLLALNAKKTRLNKDKSRSSRVKKVGDSTNRTINRKEYSYNISVASDTTVVKQTRKEYRKTHLRPNGKKYDE